MPRKISRDSVPKDSASIANKVLKRGTIMLLLVLKLYAVQGLVVKYERALK